MIYKTKQNLMICACMAVAIALYRYHPTAVAPREPDEVQATNPTDFDLLGTKLFTPKKATQPANVDALQQYLRQQH